MAIPIEFMTIVIRKPALKTQWYGGLETFLRNHAGAAEDDDLLGLAFMSSGEAQELVERLRLGGLQGGRDFALGEMFHGEWEACEGIEFHATEQCGPFKRWEARAVTGPRRRP